LKFEPDEPVEERLARLESDVKHIQSDVSEMKAHLLRVDAKIDAIIKSMSDLKVWWLVTLLATVLGAIGRGFKWI